MTPHRAFAVAVGALIACVAACGGGGDTTAPPPPPVPGAPGLHIVSGDNATDTALATLAAPLVVELRDERGYLMVGASIVMMDAQRRGNCVKLRCPILWLRDSPNDRFDQAISATTDANGRVQIQIHYDSIAGTDTLYMTEAALGDSGVAVFNINPGAATQVVIDNSDTTVYVGHSYALRAHAGDKYGNPRADTGLTFASTSAVASISADGVITGKEIGRTALIATFGSTADTAFVTVPPVGTLAAVDNRISGCVGLVRVGLDGSDYRVLAPHSCISDLAPAWAPSGEVLYHTAALDDAHIHAVDSTGQVRDFFTEDLTPAETAPRLTADRSSVFYLAGASDGPLGIWRARADGTGADATKCPAGTLPAPSPDGSRLAFLSESSLYLCTVSTGDFTSLGQGGVSALAWSPVGDRIAFIMNDAIWLIAPDGSALARLTPDNSASLTLDWSPDGRWLITHDTGYNLEVVNVSTGEQLPLTFSRTLAWVGWKP